MNSSEIVKSGIEIGNNALANTVSPKTGEINKIIEIKSLSTEEARRLWKESFEKYQASPTVKRAEADGRRMGLPGF